VLGVAEIVSDREFRVLPTKEARLVKALGDAVKRQEIGFWLTANWKIILPLERVTVPICMFAVVFVGKVAIIVAGPDPAEGENEVIPVEVDAVQLQLAGDATIFHCTLVTLPATSRFAEEPGAIEKLLQFTGAEMVNEMFTSGGGGGPLEIVFGCNVTCQAPGFAAGG